MIRTALVAGAVVLTTGCAQMQKTLTLATMSTTERAKYDCVQFGHQMGTPAHTQCVQQTVLTQRVIDGQPRPYTPRTWTCDSMMGTTTCRGM